MRVSVRNNNVNRALSIFKKKSGEILLEVRRREYYEKPTAERNRRRKAAELREKRRQAQARSWV